MHLDGAEGRIKVVTGRFAGKFAALALSLVLAACASREPAGMGGPQASAEGEPGVLWTFATYKKKFFESWNHAIVIEVDGVKTARFPGIPPVMLAPGKHMVQVEYEKDSSLCGYFGCIPFKQATRQLELQVEPDHSYLPLAGKYCGKDWIWIVDTGGSAEKEIASWREHGILPFTPFDPRSPLKDASGLKVAAGEAPPEQCEAGQK